MHDKLLAEFPSVSYEAWRAQVEQDLKGADFDKRLLTRTLEGIVVQPLYTARDVSELASTWQPTARTATPGASGPDLRAEQTTADPALARAELASDLAAGATSLWLRFDARARTGNPQRTEVDGLVCESAAQLEQLLAGMDSAKTALALDAGGNVAAAALVLALGHARELRGTLGCDPLGALARDGELPYDLDTARALFVELNQHVAHSQPQLRATQVASDAYHLAGANSAQELAYAFATGAEYLRWSLAAGLTIEQASAQIGFRVQVASDLFLELAKLRALRLGWAKIVAAHGGSAEAQTTHVHAVTSLRTKTRRDPWVNMLRTTTEAFAAWVGGADAVTTRAFDAALGHSDDFARRIARNVQVVLNEEAHVTQVLDAAGGSYYVESLTDQLVRAAWQHFQTIEARGGMSSALSSGVIAQEIAATAKQRESAVAKRLAPITGVSEFANLHETPVTRAPVTRPALQTSSAPVQALSVAKPGERFAAAVAAARSGTTLLQLTAALSSGGTHATCEPLPVHHSADPYEALRDRVERHAAVTGQPVRVFLCNLGAIPKHKARASFATGFFNAGGVAVLDNDGFGDLAAAVAAFTAAQTSVAVICGGDDQYLDWVPQLGPALRNSGARQIIVAGRPGEQQRSFEQAGVSSFIYVGSDVVAQLSALLDGMGVAS